MEIEPYQKSADEWIELYTESMYDAPLIDGAIEALEAFKQAGIIQIILSASEKQRLTTHLKKLGIIEYFDRIYGSDNVYAKGKAEIAADLSADKDLFPCVLIGDTDHDYKCSQLIGCDCMLFSGGFMSQKRLNALSAPVYNSLNEIVKKITL